MRRWSFAVGVTLLALGTGTAYAAVDQDAASRVGACSKLPLSQRGICKHEALGVAQTATPLSVAGRQALMTKEATCDRLPRSERVACKKEGYASAPAEPMTPQQERTLRSEDARYQAALAECRRLPLSRWDTCFSQAGDDQALSRSG
jgi:hypothetical protein